LDEGIKLMDGGKLDEAKEKFEGAVSQDPESYPARYYLGEVLFRLRRFAEAEVQFQEALRINPSSQSARFELGLVAEMKGEYQKAYEFYHEVIEKAPGEPEAEAALGRLRPWGETREAFLASHEHLLAAERLLKETKVEEAEREYEKVLTFAPLNSPAIRALGLIALQTKKNDKAIEMFERFVRLNPTAYVIFYRLATLYDNRGDLEKAIRTYKIVVNRGGKSVEANSARRKLAIIGDSPEVARLGLALFTVGREQLKQGRLEEALSTLLQVLSLIPGNSQSHMLVAQIYLRQGNEDQAINEYKKIHAVEPTHYPSHAALGFLYLNRGLLDEARAELEIVVRAAPDPEQVATAKKYLALIDAEAQKVQMGTGARAHHARSIELSRAGRFEEAIGELEEAVRLEPKNHFFHHNLGIIYFNHGEVAKSYFEFQKAVELRDDYLPSHFLLGLFYLTSHLYNSAISEFEKVVSLSKGGEFQVEEARKQIATLTQQLIDEQESMGHGVLGTTFVNQGDTARAREQYELALEIDPNSATNHYNMALLEFNDGYPDLAEAGFYDAINADPNYAVAYFYIGSMRQKEGKIDEAIRFYLKVLEQRPDHFLSHIALGEIFENRDLLLPALDRYRIALELDPEDKYHLGSILEQKLATYEKRYNFSLGYTMMSYDSNINATPNPVPDYATGFSAALTYYPYKTRRLSVPLSFDTSEAFYVQSQIFVGQITTGPTFTLTLSDFTLSFAYRYNYVQTNTGPSSRNNELQGSVRWVPTFLKSDSITGRLFPSSVAMSYRYRDVFSFDSFLLDATQQTYSVSMAKVLPPPFGVASVSYSVFDADVVDTSQARTQRTWGGSYFKPITPRLRLSLSYSQTRTALKVANFFTRQIETHHLTSFGAGLSYDLTPTFHYSFNVSNQISKSNLNPAFAGTSNLAALASGQTASLVDYRKTNVSLSFSFDF
jgi:tetratricopeptide (TPR) repeat protein